MIDQLVDCSSSYTLTHKIYMCFHKRVLFQKISVWFLSFKIYMCFIKTYQAMLLAQRPITLVLMMINSCSYITNDLVFNQYQIFDQDLSWYLASTKNLKSKFWSQYVLIQELAYQDCINQEESSSLDQGLDQVKKDKKNFNSRFPRRLVSCL